MPELPEVETIRRGLENFILGQKILEVQIFSDKSFLGPSELIIGQKITKLHRRGKALLVDLSNQTSLMIHLRMTGQLIFRRFGSENGAELTKMIKSGHFHSKLAGQNTFAGGHPTNSFFTELPNSQTRVQIKLETGFLFFNDQRKFGFIKVLPTAEIAQDTFIKKLAKEPWQLDPTDFYHTLQRHPSANIKALLLDQSIIAGIGNIYADEALFDAAIDPRSRAAALSQDQSKQLLLSACKVMDASIDSGGSTMATYLRADGSKGDYLEKFAQVFRRENLACQRCGDTIIKIRVAGRGTHLCPNCQKLITEPKDD